MLSNMRHYKCEALLQAIMVEKKDEKAAAGAGGGGNPQAATALAACQPA